MEKRTSFTAKIFTTEAGILTDDEKFGIFRYQHYWIFRKNYVMCVHMLEKKLKSERNARDEFMKHSMLVKFLWN